MIKKVPTEKLGALVALQLHLKKAQTSVFFHARGRGNGSGKKGLTASDIWVLPVRV